ncbi:MAG TPA: ester cyclase [Ktedonobacterales bacterium]|nr:ester cyclase [Ktedonobacterales bacterium]
MSAEYNKDLVRRFQDDMAESLRTGNVDPLLSTLHPDCTFGMPGMPPTVEGMRQVLPAFGEAFSDLRITVSEMIVDGDKVAYRLTFSGTHTGEFMGIPATGKRVTVTETHIDQIADGKIVRHDGDWDQLGMLQQLGVVPAMG